eukprot:1028569-Pyramimonas_sp.AAC.1
MRFVKSAEEEVAPVPTQTAEGEAAAAMGLVGAYGMLTEHDLRDARPPLQLRLVCPPSGSMSSGDSCDMIGTDTS